MRENRLSKIGLLVDNYKFIVYFFVVSLFFISCSSQKVNQTSNDLLYKKDNNQLNAQFVVYHVNDSVSRIHYKVPNDLFLYKKLDTSDFFYSNIKLFLKISEENSLSKFDTISYSIYDRKQEVSIEEITGDFLIKLYSLKKYHVTVNLKDVNKGNQYLFTLYSDKSSKNTRENFLIKTILNQTYYTNYFKSQENVYFTSDRNEQMVLQVDYFKSKFKLAPPPFSLEPMPQFSYSPDSVFAIYQSDAKFELTLPQKGFFHVKTNEQTKEGLTFFVFENTYPKIKNTEQMILATRFIMSKKEFDACINAIDKKASIDKFWLDIAGSEERAKELIKKYYGRVQEANKLFLSYQEGWKTDRGMIYIVFGAPNKVTKHKNGEVWTYGEVGNSNSVVYSFLKVINPFTDNDYYLERSETLKNPWYQAVDMWRQGRVYLDN